MRPGSERSAAGYVGVGRRGWCLLLPLLVFPGFGCADSECGGPREIPGVQVRMEFPGEGGFFSTPFPSDHRLRQDGGVSLEGFPNPDGLDYVGTILDILEAEARGFGVTSGLFFALTGEAGADRLPATPLESLAPESTVFLIDVDPDSPERGRRFPLYAGFDLDPGPLGEANLLACLPVQGIPLKPSTLYAAGVMRTLGDARGEPLGVSLAMARLAAGMRPEGMGAAVFSRYRTALASLRDLGLEPSCLAGLAVFTTGAPEEGMAALAEHIRAIELPPVLDAWETTDVFDDYCVLESRIEMPVFQEGTPPFLLRGGRIRFDDQGSPLQQGSETARVVITLPRSEEPTAGFPFVVFIRTGGGGDRPMVDRGRRACPGEEPVEAGEGPARYFASAGFAGVTFDGPHGGLRNVSGLDEQLLVFNFLNPAALVDNIRESAVETILVARLATSLAFDPDLCPGVEAGGDGAVHLDSGTMAVMGHSMGATIGPLAQAMEPGFRAAIWSGAGGSYIENILFKESPLHVKPIASAILRYHRYGIDLHRLDPFLSILQWASEPADPPVYGRTLRERDPGGSPQHILMFQGIVDTYITTSIANAMTGSFSLDLGGEALEASILDMVEMSGGGSVALPASGNLTAPDGSPVTGVVVQHPEDGVEDGHEIVFQRDEPKRQYGRFLATFAEGLPVVPTGEIGK